jgi:hypothetical protein
MKNLGLSFRGHFFQGAEYSEENIFGVFDPSQPIMAKKDRA